MNQITKEKRITELDCLRGIAILCDVADQTSTFGKKFGGWAYQWTDFAWFVKQYCGAFFVLLSGVCVTLGHKSLKRGLTVFGFGMVLTAITEWLYLSGRENEHILIQWGVLHCIGFCMIVWPLLKKIPLWPRAFLGAVIVVVGYYLRLQVHVRNPWLFPLGLRTWDFTAMDYFPIMPHLGWFLLGSCIGERVYKDREPVVPSLKPGFFAFCGRHSLVFYLLQQLICYVFFKSRG